VECRSRDDLDPRYSHRVGLDIVDLSFRNFAFFGGVISGYQHEPPVYLIDGVAVNGVSGGPAFDSTRTSRRSRFGVPANRVDASRTLPGLMILTPLNLIRMWMQGCKKCSVSK
jgi:hypothetical protein